MSELVEKQITVSGMEIVEKGKKPNTWKEISVKVEPYEKGTHYSIPIKKKDGTSTVAYEFYKTNRAVWEESFIENKLVPLVVGYDEKSMDWEKDGKVGTSIYRSIRYVNIPVPGGETEYEINADEADPRNISF